MSEGLGDKGGLGGMDTVECQTDSLTLLAVLMEHGVEASDPWICKMLGELEEQVQALLAAVEGGELSQQQFANLMLFKVDAVLAAVYAQQGLDELARDRLRVDVLKVLDKPLKEMLGVDLLV